MSKPRARRSACPDETFFVSPETRSYFAKHKEKLTAAYKEWQSAYEAWREANRDLASELDAVLSGETPDLLSVIPKFDPTANIATRKAGSDVLQPLAQAMPLVISGSADLHGSTLNYIKDGGDFNSKNRGGSEPSLWHPRARHVRHSQRPRLRWNFPPQWCDVSRLQRLWSSFHPLASLSKLPVVYIFTHDSVGVGEDGPTHEPVETVAALRAIPGLDVIRPADPEETAGAFAAAFQKTDGPTLLALFAAESADLERNIPSNCAARASSRAAMLRKRRLPRWK